MNEYMDRTWLEEHYVNKNMTAKQIGDMFDKTGNTISFHIKKYGLIREKNTKKPLNMKNAEVLKNSEWLYDQYILQNKSYDTIAKEFKLGKTTVARYVKRYGLDKLKSTKTSGKRSGELPKVLTQCSYCGKDKLVKGCRFAENETRFCNNTCASKYATENTDIIERLQEGCSIWRETEEAKLFMREHGARTYANQDTKETAIERKLAELLTKEGIAFETQKKMYYWCVDFFLPEHDIVIEAQGDYWHAHPDKYPEPNEMQKKNIRRDKGKASYIPKCGHTFLAFWERDIQDNPEGVLNEIRTVLQLKAAI